ncbi:hypothetical protein EDC04DRAFT_2731086 [Pisolithus marmoratus]|nr:hypothetical protein EDC04DRAFT_2731086 [Pisolithus marmoratus]
MSSGISNVTRLPAHAYYCFHMLPIPEVIRVGSMCNTPVFRGFGKRHRSLPLFLFISLPRETSHTDLWRMNNYSYRAASFRRGLLATLQLITLLGSPPVKSSRITRYQERPRKTIHVLNAHVTPGFVPRMLIHPSRNTEGRMNLVECIKLKPFKV